MHMSLPKRSGTKAVTYRVINVAVAFGWLSFLFGFEVGGSVALVDAAISTFLYYGHERIWDRITWGRDV